MEAFEINRMLYRHFCNYNYRLNNAFVYGDWESDFFAISKSDYCIEVEVKVSRGDYFRDFEKDKHKLFRALLEKRTHVISTFSTRGDYICGIRTGELTDRWGWRSANEELGTRMDFEGRGGYWVNDFIHVNIRHRIEEIYARATGVHFREVAKCKCPNQIYFACPEGLLKESEIPAYAGLMYCKNGVEIVKRAPYLHKVKQDMTRALLKQFYNRWEYKTDVEFKIMMTKQFNLFHPENNRIIH